MQREFAIVIFFSVSIICRHLVILKQTATLVNHRNIVQVFNFQISKFTFQFKQIFRTFNFQIKNSIFSNRKVIILRAIPLFRRKTIYTGFVLAEGKKVQRKEGPVYAIDESPIKAQTSAVPFNCLRLVVPQQPLPAERLSANEFSSLRWWSKRGIAEFHRCPSPPRKPSSIFLLFFPPSFSSPLCLLCASSIPLPLIMPIRLPICATSTVDAGFLFDVSLSIMPS